MRLKGNKNLRNYNFKILDSFNNELNDFDLVATGLNEQGNIATILGIYYKTQIITFADFENRDGLQSLLSSKKYNLYSTDKYFRGFIDRVKVEYGDLPGTYKLKNAIKIENLDIPMKCFKDTIFKMLKDYKVNNTISRKLLNEIIDDMGRLELL